MPGNVARTSEVRGVVRFNDAEDLMTGTDLLM
jgi:hypothetical protein